jgi:hypothetical protein
MQHLAQEMVNLRHNDQVLADAMDLNFRAVAKALELAGIPLDKQQEIIKLAQEEIQKDREGMAEAQKKAVEHMEKKAKDESEKEAVETETDVPGEAPPAPTEATQFGG